MTKASKGYKTNAIRMAKQLGYIDRVPNLEEKIRNAETETQISNILTRARLSLC